MGLSCGFPPTREIVDHARRAEALGYERVWLFDSPAVYGDVWIALARIAEATGRIGLGTAVAVPHLRHVLVTASAIASVEELAPGRLACAFGTGFTARRALGKSPLSWAYTRRYVEQLRALLRGETVPVDGGACQMIHAPGYAPPRPIATPLLVGALGPKGQQIAREIGDGIVCAGAPAPGFAWCVLLVNGTVLDAGEDHETPRVRAAAGPWYVATYHALFELSPDALDGMPGGAVWRRALEAERPSGERHLALHEGHVVAVMERDRPLLDAAGPALLGSGLTGTPEQVTAKVAAARAGGATEILYAPAGPDVARELEAFAAAAAASA